MPRLLFALILSNVALLLGGCPLDYAGFFPPLSVVPELDLERYSGKWYEIARYPNWFERGCEGVTAEYTPRDDGSVGVLNICRNADGTEASRIEGRATRPDATEPGKLSVFFATSPFGAPYWVLALGDDYEYAVVGEPSRGTFWILSRTPQMDPAVYAALVAQMPDWGYDADRLELVSQPEAP